MVCIVTQSSENNRFLKVQSDFDESFTKLRKFHMNGFQCPQMSTVLHVLNVLLLKCLIYLFSAHLAVLQNRGNVTQVFWSRGTSETHRTVGLED